MNSTLTQLAERREHLVAQAAAQRTALAQNAAPWRAPLALAGLTGVFLAGGLAALGFARHKLKTKPRLFAASLAELSRDRQHLMDRS